MIKPPVAILGAGRCGTSALAGALVAGGWNFPGEKPNIEKLKERQVWVPGYYESHTVPKSGNYKSTYLQLPKKLRGDETVIMMTRNRKEHARAFLNGILGDSYRNKAESEVYKIIDELEEHILKFRPDIVINFNQFLRNPRRFLEKFDVDVDKAVEFIKPNVTRYGKRY